MNHLFADFTLTVLLENPLHQFGGFQLQEALGELKIDLFNQRFGDLLFDRLLFLVAGILLKIGMDAGFELFKAL